MDAANVDRAVTQRIGLVSPLGLGGKPLVSALGAVGCWVVEGYTRRAIGGRSGARYTGDSGTSEVTGQGPPIVGIAAGVGGVGRARRDRARC